MVRAFLFVALCLTFLLGACADDSLNKDADYDATKKMVIDIIQTEEGKKALQEVITDEDMKKELVIQPDIVKDSINEAFTSTQGTEMWVKLFQDSSFVESFVKSTEDGQKRLLKELMHDADFQKQMLDLLQNPEIAKQTLTVMKGQKFREHLEETIQQTLRSPLFQANIEKILLEAAEKKNKEEKEEKKSSEDKESEQE